MAFWRVFSFLSLFWPSSPRVYLPVRVVNRVRGYLRMVRWALLLPVDGMLSAYDAISRLERDSAGERPVGGDNGGRMPPGAADRRGSVIAFRFDNHSYHFPTGWWNVCGNRRRC